MIVTARWGSDGSWGAWGEDWSPSECVLKGGATEFLCIG